MRILLGMSGGLDSTYAAHLLLSQGHEVEGAVLKMSEYTEVEAAGDSAAALGIKLHVIDCMDAFRKHVVTDLIKVYSSGRTPNPCIMCNRYVKIQQLCEYAEANGFDKAATGHYASVAQNPAGRWYIERAGDSKKDQSYVLWQLTQEQLAKLITPLAGLTKDSIRAEASKLGLKAADRRESQEICFIPDKDYAGFIEREHGVFPEGDFLDVNGNVVGRHKGIIHYTIGQRKKLGIALGRRIFITNIDTVKNTITVADAGEDIDCEADIERLNFQYIAPPDSPFELDCTVKIRYAAQPAEATVSVSGGEAHIKFKNGVKAITPGQSAVCYDGGKILFGGFIT